MKRLNFEQAPIFYVFDDILGKAPMFYDFASFFVLQIFVYIFSIYLCILYAPIFLAQLF
jgi:hypothetical protein